MKAYMTKRQMDLLIEKQCVSSAFYADFCLCPKSAIISALNSKMIGNDEELRVIQADLTTRSKTKGKLEHVMTCPYIDSSS